MEKDKNSIDEFFREILHGHEIQPSGRAKEHFLKEVTESKKRKWSRVKPFFYILLALLIIAGSTGLYLLLNNPGVSDSSITETDSSIRSLHQKINTSSPSIPSKSGQQFYTQPLTEKHDQNQQSSSEFKDTDIPGQIYLTPDKNKNIAVITTGETERIDSAAKPVIKEIVSVNVEQEQTHKLDTASAILPDDNLSKPLSVVKDTLETPEPSIMRGNAKKQKPERDWYFSIGVFYTPEWMFNTLENVKYMNNFGIEGILTYGSYSVRTGLGLSVTKGTNEIAVEYNDYIGSYNKLDSMSFTWDGAIHDFIPTFYLKNLDVYDSLMKLDYLYVIKRYSYLQIPLVFGYDFLRSGRFSIGVRTGPQLSILLSSEQLSEEYDPGKKKVISINYITPEQVSLNWQFMAGINASVGLSKNLGLEIEPMAKYYFNSVYEKSEITEKPWSIGVRAALILKLK